MAGARRAHNKTRLGCGGCKKRRVKCDGRHPTCANCERRGLECSFLLLAPSSLLPTIAGTSSPTSSASKSVPYKIEIFRRSAPSSRASSHDSLNANSSASGQSPSRSQSEDFLTDVWSQCRDNLEPYQQTLLDRYISSTCRTLATDQNAQLAWRTFVPELALQHKYLVYGVLSIAALDLARLPCPREERDELYRIAAEQMNRAISLFRVELGNINEENAAALFAHSTLTAVYFFRTSALDMEEARAAIPPGSIEPPKESIDEMIQSFWRTISGLRGALTVLKPGWNWVVGGELSSLCNRKWWPKHRIPQTERAKEEDRRLAEMEKLWINEGRPYEDHFKILSEALEHLRETFVLVSLLTDPATEWPRTKAEIPYAVDDTTVGMLRDRAAIFVWAVRVTPEFLALGQEKNTEVLVLVAHYAVLFGRVRNVWWMEGLGPNTIWAVAMALGPEKRHLVEWPAQALGIDLRSEIARNPPGREETSEQPYETAMVIT